MVNAVENWLEKIMPAVVETLSMNWTEEVLHKMGEETGIHGPFSVDLEEFRAPITGINFYAMVVENTMMLAVTADIRNADEGDKPNVKFDMVLPVNGFAAAISDEKNFGKLVSQILEQYKTTC